MKRTVTLIILLAASGFNLAAQQTAQMQSEPSPAVRAGHVITFTIKLDRPPNFNGGSLEFGIAPVSPQSSTAEIRTNTNVEQGQSVLRLGMLIPVTSQTDSWHVTRVVFHTPGKPETPLSFHDIQFKVERAPEPTGPDSAIIEISK